MISMLSTSVRHLTARDDVCVVEHGAQIAAVKLTFSVFSQITRFSYCFLWKSSILNLSKVQQLLMAIVFQNWLQELNFKLHVSKNHDFGTVVCMIRGGYANQLAKLKILSSTGLLPDLIHCTQIFAFSWALASLIFQNPPVSIKQDKPPLFGLCYTRLSVQV